MIDLESISVTSAKRKQFESRGIYSVEDLLSFVPKKYNDFTKITGILPSDQVSCVKARVKRVDSHNAGKTPFVSAVCEEFTSGIPITVMWFHSQWKYPELRSYLNCDIVAAGKIDYNERYGSYTMIQPTIFGPCENALGVYPVYRSVPGMSNLYFSQKMKDALSIGVYGSEILPEDIIRREGETPMPQALRYVHTPKTTDEAHIGMDRILLNDLLYFSLHNELNKIGVSNGSQYNIKTLELERKALDTLPYDLTDDQKTALEEMINTAKDGRRLNALVQGDVGCGKTVVCALLAAAFIGSGYQAVLMAPTQVLAKQHLDTMHEMFDILGVQIAYIDSSMKVSEKRKAIEAISSGRAKLIVGTHSCISKDVVYNNLALTIVDEEHKFGVKQRAAIIDKASGGVHSLTMSATPIPRSLAQVIYGDSIQLHTIKTMPKGRLPIITGIATDQMRVYRFLLSEVRKQHQVYVVCPMIDPNEKLENVFSVEEVSKAYNTVFEKHGVRIATLTGRDKPDYTKKIIQDFKDGLIDILIATTVIEVGVNVPNATVMVVSNAERFGLSGLHQLRGRVGRGNLQSYCVLQSTSEDQKALNRLKVMCDSNNGFEIAEADLKQRGAGDFLGTQQSGDNKYIALMLANPETYKKAVRIARELIDRGMDCCKLTERVAAEREGEKADG